MANNDLLKWVTSDVDFYELLGITFEAFTANELRRAYRKTALKYHPDKVGANFDADKYELFQAAHEVLAEPELKAKYDNHRAAKLQKQRANELFEGKRRQMKEDLEARERGGVAAGMKRPREEEAQSEMNQELRKLAEEGRKRRAARKSMMSENIGVDFASSPAPAPSSPRKEQPKTSPPPAEEQAEEDKVKELERRIREAKQAKEKRKADKKARKSGIFVPADSLSVGSTAGSGVADKDTATPIKRPDIFKGLKADEKSSASPKFSFSPNTPKNDFSATMARLKAAEKQRLEEEIRQQESETV
ncbi:Pre-mRNA-splicing factor cwf23, partial [Lachnellula suecica]